MAEPRRAAIYARVSTDGQSVENQLAELQRVVSRHGWEVAGVYTDEGISGAKGRDRRPGFDALCNAVSRREVDVVAAWSVDRLGRSLQDLVAFLGELRAKGLDLYLHVQGLDTATPAGRAMFGMLGVFAEFERGMIQERVRAGLARARARGKRLGRPPSLTQAQVRDIARDREAGLSLRRLATKYGTTPPTVRRVLMAGGA
ncbi:MAG: recombinase family protein [Planctomycetota bacterium]|jgi:DNA invertase Pin-like site-specific DNA recombinase